MSEILKPCPFCGGELPVHYTVMKNQYVQLISCPDCNATVVSTKFRSDRDALAIWQNRPIEDALNARIAELEEYISQLVEAGDKSMNFVEGFCNMHSRVKPDYWHKWKALVKGWKEG